jgi:ferredoxin
MTGSRKWLEAELARHGLRLRGGWIPAPQDGLARLTAGPVAVVWMVGQVGSECWPAFADSSFLTDGRPDPLDRWSQHIGDALAMACGGRAIYPSDGPPYAPFQQWARRAEPLATSPLMLQIHPQYGLWHAYRFALALPVLDAADASALMQQAGAPAAVDLCLSCDGQPCLSACPVDAFTPSSYDVDRCAGHLHGADGSDCMESGCRARRTCPVGTGHRYGRAHAAFHMAAFAGSHGCGQGLDAPDRVPTKREP